MKENPISFQLKLKPEDFLPATEEEKQSQVVMRESVSFWKDGARRLRKNKVAMVSLVVIIIVMIFSFIVPSFYPYTYKEQIKGANNLRPMQYSEQEQARIDAGEKVFPHIFGTDKMGRDYAIRVIETQQDQQQSNALIIPAGKGARSFLIADFFFLLLCHLLCFHWFRIFGSSLFLK